MTLTALEAAFHTDPLSEEAERMLDTFSLDQARYVISRSDPLKIFSNLRLISKFFDSYDREELAGIKSLWAENCEAIIPLIVQSLAEQTVASISETPNTVALIATYGQQLDLVEELFENIAAA